MDEAQWTLVRDYEEPGATPIFGAADSIPITGDFNGDGHAEIGVFLDGDWFVDLNGNGQWDEGDLWAQLGTDGDKPVVGDWDGDGKDDIGIFGPAWAGDPRAITREPGLPHSLNRRNSIAKNVPPKPEDASLGKRMVKVTSQGALRADLIDHVFNYGVAGDRAVAGDWAGNGVDCIAVYRDGVWHLDLDGDGRFTDVDRRADFGAKDDLPVVGDWNGDGITNVGVYRDGNVDPRHQSQLPRRRRRSPGADRRRRRQTRRRRLGRQRPRPDRALPRRPRRTLRPEVTRRFLPPGGCVLLPKAHASRCKPFAVGQRSRVAPLMQNTVLFAGWLCFAAACSPKPLRIMCGGQRSRAACLMQNTVLFARAPNSTVYFFEPLSSRSRTMCHSLILSGRVLHSNTRRRTATQARLSLNASHPLLASSLSRLR